MGHRSTTRPVAYVYLLRCGDGSLYCGWTVDVQRRVDRHARGLGGRYTRSRLPVALAAAWETPDARTARRLEARVKRLPRPAKERLVSGELGLPLDDGDDALTARRADGDERAA